ncbi:hypothetical protein C2S53_020483 [Perilla frutescens var. hirtella]|uniref:F-box domain-containing protein n=1 Tax=Perilla frutescens var. hirtella TaxID=608512 RepID=A0AAD4JI31_PERFH|nr:hypothetical protein C2S53_020483 [Perilla frutescens var. hirtella]
MASTPPEQERRRCCVCVPSEIVEEVPLNLPVKSLLRFCKVSKSWNSMIFDARFIRRQRSRAAIPGHESIMIGHTTEVHRETSRLVRRFVSFHEASKGLDYRGGVFLRGALHWIPCHCQESPIISEEYEEMAQPPSDPITVFESTSTWSWLF